MPYTKLFSSILTSTIWVESDRTRIVWITMLALADKNGEVQASIPGLARVAGVPLEDCEAAIEKFLAPDPYSRTPDDEGRRIEVIAGGWALINHEKYREMASRDEAQEAAAERQRRRRDRVSRNASVTPRHGLSRSVTHCHAPSRCVTVGHGSVTPDLHIADTDAEAEASNHFPTSAAAEDGGAGSDELDLGPTDAAPTVSTFPAPQMPAAPKEQPATPPLADPRHHEITSAWGPAFLEAFGVDYQFSGRDAKTLKRFLAGSRATSGDLLATARAAWDRTKVDRYARNCKEAATIHGLCTHYNEIRVEVQSPPLGAAPVRQGAAPASQGHTRAPTVWELREREKAIFDALRDLSDGRKGQRYVGMRPGHTSAYEWTPDGIAERERLNEELKTVRAALAAAPGVKSYERKN